MLKSLKALASQVQRPHMVPKPRVVHDLGVIVGELGAVKQVIDRLLAGDQGLGVWCNSELER